ncbi:MAG: hypothetical protein DCF23_10705 [Cyanobium sp.]|nr:MAG: hypothetical protein DCF23_10705 [Cyanobium sp.]
MNSGCSFNAHPGYGPAEVMGRSAQLAIHTTRPYPSPRPAAMTTPCSSGHVQKRSLGWLATLSLLVLPTLSAPLQGQAKTETLTFPSSGVICDSAVRICYDSDGASLPLTRRHFDRRAEQNLKRLLSGRTIPREFQFSGGEVCDVQRQLCWDNGWKKTNVSNRLSRQLFGSVRRSDDPWANNNSNNNWGNNWGNNSNNNSNNNWNNNSTNNWNQNQQANSCELSQSGRSVFNGSCDLRQRSTANGTAYSVELQNGRQFAFYNRQGELVLRDGTGTWPVRTARRGNEVIFSWGNQRLITRVNDQQVNPTNLSPSLNPTNQFLQGLFNNLFR